VHELVLVEWEDSVQPISSWRYLHDLPSLEAVQCVSVGWIVGKNDRVIMLAPNIGDYESGDGAQGTGFIRIPQRSITRMVELVEVTSSDDLSFHPDSKRMLPTS